MPIEGGRLMRVKEVMNTKVRIIPEETSLQEALERMKRNNTGVALVREDDHIEGILAAKDVLMRKGVNKDRIRQLKVRDMMRPKVQFVYEDQPVQVVRTLMKERHLSYLAVLNRSNKIRGLCTRQNVGLDA